MKIVVCASLAFSLVNFRGALLAKLARHHQVIACAPDHDADVCRDLEAMGVAFRQIPMRRAALSPFSDLRTLAAYVRLFRRERPDIVLAYTQKPIIYAGIATRLHRRTRFFAMVSGLGHVFSGQGGGHRRLIRLVVSKLYRVAVRRAEAVFTFNRDDHAEMIAAGIVGPHHRVTQVPGSGVDTTQFAERPVPGRGPTFLLIARLLRDKGLYEYAEAARQVRKVYPSARFQLLGPLDDNPGSITRDELQAWREDGLIDYLGTTRDVAPYLAACAVFVLPTCYREGLPRSILEAMATGRPVIATDAPGCRDAVRDGINGYLVQPRDVAGLAGAMLRLAADRALCERMGAASREIAESVYQVDKVNALIVETMALEDGPLPAEHPSVARRLVDAAAAIVVGVVLLPAIALIALLIAGSLGRPIFFRQVRSGQNGRPFELVKFRTMREPRCEAERLSTDAERLTRLGRFLRRTRLDELPSLLNVLRGDMNVIGPRPLLTDTIATMGDAGRQRGTVRPGLTGWAQVNGGPLLLQSAKLDLDLWYTRHASIWLDLRILFRTILVILLSDRLNHRASGVTHASAGRRGG